MLNFLWTTVTVVTFCLQNHDLVIGKTILFTRYSSRHSPSKSSLLSFFLLLVRSFFNLQKCKGQITSLFTSRLIISIISKQGLNLQQILVFHNDHSGDIIPCYMWSLLGISQSHHHHYHASRESSQNNTTAYDSIKLKRPPFY